MNQEEEQTIGKRDIILDVLVLPSFLPFVDYNVLKSYNLISKSIYKSISDDHFGHFYWKSRCNSFAAHVGLYMSPQPMPLTKYRQYFLNELWSTRNKWNMTSSEATSIPIVEKNEFKIKVGARFRPGARGMEKVCLPLHQYLKVKRNQLLLEKTENQSSIIVGEVDPEQFVDPFLGTLMKDPVLLTTSNRIVDRSIALQSILRGGHDPFNGLKLTQTMLIPQLELKLQIQEWKKKKENRDVSLGIDEVKSLIDEGSVDPELLAALMEVERMSNLAKRLEFDARRTTTTNTVDGTVINEINPQQEDVPEAITVAQANALVAAMTHETMTSETTTEVDIRSENLDDIFKARKNETARVVDISKPKSTISLNVPGAGIKSFQFMNVFDENASQSNVYNQSIQEMVVAMLNGFNSCVLCYGQVSFCLFDELYLNVHS